MLRRPDTPDKIGKTVHAGFTGAGTCKILLIAHMDTVYPRGTTALHPFEIKGTRVRGAGVLDDKQGLAMIVHTVSLLAKTGFRDYARLVVLVNGDEEIGSPSSSRLLTRLGAEHDVTFSLEGAWQHDALRLATSGIASAVLEARGRSSHAGVAPEQGVNALYELSHLFHGGLDEWQASGLPLSVERGSPPPVRLELRQARGELIGSSEMLERMRSSGGRSSWTFARSRSSRAATSEPFAAATFRPR